MPATLRAARRLGPLVVALMVVPAPIPAPRAAAQLLAATAFPEIPVIVIDPGHGGPDPGAVICRLRFAGRRCMAEKDVTLDIALRTARLLRAQGFQVTVTRTTDQAVNHPARNIATWNKHKSGYRFGVDGKVDVDDELQARTNVADCNHKYGCAKGVPTYADAFVSLHENACAPGCNASGTMIFHWHQ